MTTEDNPVYDTDEIDKLVADEQATEQAEYNPAAEQAEVEHNQAAHNGAKALAALSVETVSSIIQAAQPVSIDQPTKDELAGKLAPVLHKYGLGGEMPPWLAAYREELELGMALAGFAYGLYQQIKTAQQDEQESDSGQPPQPQAR